MKVFRQLLVTVLCGLVFSLGCSDNKPSSINQGDSVQQSDDDLARSALESYLTGQESANMKFNGYDITKTNSITSPYEATAICQMRKDGRDWESIATFAYRNGEWKLVDMKLVD